MFGIGFEEFFLIAIVLLLAVGPDKLPTFLKAVGKGVREFRRATRELKSSVGLDELMKDEDLRQLRDLRKPLSDAMNAPAKRASPGPRYALTEEDHQRELPREGVDLAHATAHPALVKGMEGPSPVGASGGPTPSTEGASGAGGSSSAPDAGEGGG
jgi:Tat protein translocase TatB subunit